MTLQNQIVEDVNVPIGRRRVPTQGACVSTTVRLNCRQGVRRTSVCRCLYQGYWVRALDEFQPQNLAGRQKDGGITLLDQLLAFRSDGEGKGWCVATHLHAREVAVASSHPDVLFRLHTSGHGHGCGFSRRKAFSQ